jgi:hypothetical protein
LDGDEAWGERESGMKRLRLLAGAFFILLMTTPFLLVLALKWVAEVLVDVMQAVTGLILGSEDIVAQWAFKEQDSIAAKEAE